LKVLPGLALEMAALHDVIEVRNHAGGDERIADVVEIEAPLVAHSSAKISKIFFVG
jgi:hypothetical protein